MLKAYVKIMIKSLIHLLKLKPHPSIIFISETKLQDANLKVPVRWAIVIKASARWRQRILSLHALHQTENKIQLNTMAFHRFSADGMRSLNTEPFPSHNNHRNGKTTMIFLGKYSLQQYNYNWKEIKLSTSKHESKKHSHK